MSCTARLVVLNSATSSEFADLPAVRASALWGHGGRSLTVRDKAAGAPGLAREDRRSTAEQLELLLRAQERCSTSLR